ncbi:MAG TPA: metabolite traffic protein EboE [Planctomycetota bacterium]|nr:metabolite traffic protein EboE [Planctomycetota bacterium]
MREPILGYATNCYAGESAAELAAAVRTEVAAVRKHLPAGEPLNLSLRISARAAREFGAGPHLLEELRTALGEAGAAIVSANAFPISAPRKGIYKDGIYSPDWTSPHRLESTLQIARAVAALLPEGAKAVLTTLTGTYRGWGCASCSEEAEADCARHLVKCAKQLDDLSRQTGRELVLALEPEPFTTAESLAGTVDFFRRRLFHGPQEAVARRRLAVNLDLCHAAVMFEDAAENLRAYAREGIPVAGLHVSAALRLDDPGRNGAGLAALRSFDEPVYLHQVSATDESRRLLFRWSDLGEFLALSRERLEGFSEARIHFHVPIFAETVGGLSTTAGLIAPALAEAMAGGHTDLFVIETYTWKLLEGTPGAAATTAEGIARELTAARGMIEGG